MVVGDDIGLVNPVASEFAIDKAGFADDLEILSLEASQADLIILDGSDDRHRSLCVRLQLILLVWVVLQEVANKITLLFLEGMMGISAN